MAQISDKLGIKGKINILLYILAHEYLINENNKE